MQWEGLGSGGTWPTQVNRGPLVSCGSQEVGEEAPAVFVVQEQTVVVVGGRILVFLRWIQQCQWTGCGSERWWRVWPEHQANSKGIELSTREDVCRKVKVV